MKKDTKLLTFLRGIIAENPVLILILGTCPTLAMTSSVVKAFSMGLAATLVLIGSNAVISALRKIIPDSVRIPCYIVIIATFVTAVQMILQVAAPDIYDSLGVYLALIVVNCIILGRAEMYARKNPVLDSVLDGAGMGIGFTIALCAMALIREVFGSASFAGIEIGFLQDYKIEFLSKAPGGLVVYGLLIALVFALTKGKGPKKHEFSCAGCPAAANCHTGACALAEQQAKSPAENSASEFNAEPDAKEVK